MYLSLFLVFGYSFKSGIAWVIIRDPFPMKFTIYLKKRLWRHTYAYTVHFNNKIDTKLHGMSMEHASCDLT